MASAVIALPKRTDAPEAAGAAGVQFAPVLQSPAPAFAHDTLRALPTSVTSMVCATVFVVKDEGKGPDGKPKLVADQRFVSTGLTRGDQVAVTEGLKPGDVVVTAGQLKLRNGTPVLINNSVQPADSAHPQVPNS